jgi:hypothetical protein
VAGKNSHVLQDVVGKNESIKGRFNVLFLWLEPIHCLGRTLKRPFDIYPSFDHALKEVAISITLSGHYLSLGSVLIV